MASGITIQEQNLLKILPVFVGLGIAIGGLTTTLRQRETLRGLKEEAGSAAIALAEFIDVNAFRQLAGRDMEFGARVACTQLLERVMESKRFTRMFVFVPGQTEAVFDLGTAWEVGRIGFELPVDVLTTVQAGRVGFRRVRARGFLQAFTAMSDDNGDVVGILGVQVSTDRLVRQHRKSLAMVTCGLSAALGLGLLCAWLITWVLRRNVVALNRAIAAGGEGETDLPLPEHQGRIRELNELGNTFNTMVSILGGVMATARRDLLELEMFRTETDLANAFEENYWTPRASVLGTIAFVVRLVGKGQPGAFLDLFEDEENVYCLFGRMDGSDHLDATRRASATLRFLKRQLDRRPIPDALTFTARLFSEITELQLVYWDNESRQLTLHRFSEPTRRFDAASVCLEPGATRFFHDLGPEADRRLDLYVRTFGEHSLLDTMDRLILVVGSIEPPCNGILALVSCREDGDRVAV